jgi:pimeloyl-ACP methyl ester carboxylesterase
MNNQTNQSPPPIFLLSGMGADERLFEKQLQVIPSLRVPQWIAPVPRESLREYAARFAMKINPGIPCYIGGASFGGFVAMEMIRHLDVKGCFLIGSVRSPKEFPPQLRALRKISGVADKVPFEVATLFCKAAIMSAGALSSNHATKLMEQLSDSDASFLRWASRAVLEWDGDGKVGDLPVYQIHGKNDLILPAKYTTPDVIVEGAGHALSMSHPGEVTEFVKSRI